LRQANSMGGEIDAENLAGRVGLLFRLLDSGARGRRF
jgi:hypothetical protein